MNKVANVISNGYSASSTILEYCSEEFKETFNRADVIISKGQNKEIYYLLIVKCDVIADVLNVKNGDFVVKRVMQKKTDNHDMFRTGPIPKIGEKPGD